MPIHRTRKTHRPLTTRGKITLGIVTCIIIVLLTAILLSNMRGLDEGTGLKSTLQSEEESRNSPQKQRHVQPKITPDEEIGANFDTPHDYSYVLKQYVKRSVTGRASECEEGFGFLMAKKWRKTAKPYCKGDSNLICRRYLQYLHSGLDLFCDGHELVFDWSKFLPMPPGEWNKDGVFGESRYLVPQTGTITGKCAIDRSNFLIEHSWPRGHFQQLYRPLFSGFEGRSEHVKCDVEVNHPVMFVIRDGRWNLYHSMADFVNAFLSLEILKLNVDDLQIVILDREEAGNYFDLWKKAFSPHHPLLHAPDLVEKGKKVCYQHAIFNIPGVSSFMCKGISTHSECFKSDMLMAFGAHITKSMLSKQDATLPAPMSITIIQRRIHPERKHMDRVISNTEDMISQAKSTLLEGMFEIRVVDFAAFSIEEQIRIARTTNMLVGIHGAGMTHQIFMSPGSSVLELLPGFGTHFSNLAQWMGHSYQQCTYDAHGVVDIGCWVKCLGIARGYMVK